MSPLRVLGIDPGSRITGYGIVDFAGQRLRHVASGTIPVSGAGIGERLRAISTAIDEVMEQYRPHQVAVEQVFMHRNAQSALKLGQARGAAIVVAAQRRAPVFEYTPTQVKQATTGRGHAAKAQVQHMVQTLLSLPGMPPEDAADALAVAICHSHHRETGARIQAAVDADGSTRGALLAQAGRRRRPARRSRRW